MDIAIGLMLIILLVISAIMQNIFLFLFFLMIFALAEINRLHRLQEKRDNQILKVLLAIAERNPRKPADEKPVIKSLRK